MQNNVITPADITVTTPYGNDGQLRAAAWAVGWNIECKHSFRQWFRKQRHASLTTSGAAWI